MKSHRIPILIVALAFGLLFANCGNKKPPVPPSSLMGLHAAASSTR